MNTKATEIKRLSSLLKNKDLANEVRKSIEKRIEFLTDKEKVTK